jgi:ATP-dependent DNA helicase DinG
VAILDERLSSKGYGRRARQDLPPARFSRDFKDVHRFFQAEHESRPEFALNVWATQNAASGQSAAAPGAKCIAWRWQLVRLLDGRADSADGIHAAPDVVAGEIFAIEQGLGDLRRRIERGGHASARFCVEIRCSAATAQCLFGANGSAPAAPAWEAEKGQWKALIFAPVRE